MTATAERCISKNCIRRVHARKRCTTHYRKWHRTLTGRLTLDPTNIRTLVAEQIRRGYLIGELAHDAGVSWDTVSEIHNGTSATVYPDTARKIAAVPLLPTQVGTERRLQALALLGWPERAIEARAGLGTTTILSGRRKRARHSAAVRRAIARIFTGTRMDLPGPSKWTATRAAKLGYRPALAWDDIDDPDAKPVGLPVPATATCRWCGGTFRPRKTTDRYCSTEHGELAHNASKREQQAARRAAARTGQVAA